MLVLVAIPEPVDETSVNIVTESPSTDAISDLITVKPECKNGCEDGNAFPSNPIHCDKCKKSFMVPHVNKKLICEKHSKFSEYSDKLICLQCKHKIIYDDPNEECDLCIRKKIDMEEIEQRKIGHKNLMFDFGQLVYVRRNNSKDQLPMQLIYKNKYTDIEYSYDLQYDVWKQLTQPNKTTLDNNPRSTKRPQIIAYPFCLQSYPCRHTMLINGVSYPETYSSMVDRFEYYQYPLPSYLHNH